MVPEGPDGKDFPILHTKYDSESSLTLSSLSKNFQQTTYWNIFLIFSRKQDLAFHANWRQSA